MAEEFTTDLELEDELTEDTTELLEDELTEDTTELLEDEIADLEDEIEEYEAEEAARRAKRKKRIILITGIAVGLAIAAALVAIFACRKKED